MNDEIVGAYVSVLNSITVRSRTALFIPPSTSGSLHLVRYFEIADHEKNKKRDKHGNVMNLKVCRSNTCGRKFLIADAFKLGYKCVYFPYAPVGSHHWVGIRVTLGQKVDDNNKVLTNYLSCDVHDTCAAEDPPETPTPDRLFPFLRTTFGMNDVRVENVWKQKENMVQSDGVSCGVFQCLLMERLALNVEDWWKGNVSVEAINKQRLNIARRIMNIQGAYTKSIVSPELSSKDDIYMDHTGYVAKNYEREIITIDDDYDPIPKIEVKKDLNKPPRLKPEDKHKESPDTDCIEELKEPSMAKDETKVPSSARDSSTPSKQEMETNKDVLSVNDPEFVTQSPIEEKHNKNKTVSTQQEGCANDLSFSGLDLLLEASKTDITVKALKDSMVPQTKEDKKPNHFKKQYAITLGGKEALVSKMDLRRMEEMKKTMNKIVNPSPSPSKKRSGKKRLEREVNEINSRSESFIDAVDRVKNKEWHFEEYERPTPAIQTTYNDTITENCKARAEENRQEQESTEEENLDNDLQVDESQKMEAGSRKETELKKKEAELKKRVGDAYWSYQYATWKKGSREEKKKTKKPPEDMEEWNRSWNTTLAKLNLKINKPNVQKNAKKKLREELTQHNAWKTQIDKILEKEIDYWKGNKQVVVMWYVPQSTKYEKRPGMRQKTRQIIPGHYKGMCDDRQESLHIEWVQKNVEKSLTDYMKSNARKRCQLPAGNVWIHDSDRITSLRVPNAPPCVHQQKDKRTCVFSSFASCVHYLGHDQMGIRLQQLSSNQSYRMNNLERLKVAVDTSLGMQCRIKKYNGKGSLKHRLDPLNNGEMREKNDIAYPTVVVLEGDDGGTEHAVTIYDNWVFDSNVEFAMPLKQNTLDWCVMGKFVRVHQAIRFYLPKSKSEREEKRQKKTNHKKGNTFIKTPGPN